jgi:hypothetical protein
MLDRFSMLARLNDDRLSRIQTPVQWITDRQRLPYCFRCLVLNDADVSAPRWKREWLDPTADYCCTHHALFETVPSSVFRRSGNSAAALRAINHYRAMRRRMDQRKVR